MADEVLLRVEGLHKYYGNLHVLRGIDLRVARGTVVVLIGPSGSGKSTFLRCLNRLEEPSSGRIFIDGVEITARHVRLPLVRRNIGMVFQHFNLFPHMSAIGNVAEGPRTVLRMSRADAESRAYDLLGKVGLSEKARARPAELSGGQQQRVAIARALAMQPEIMLFDEVTSALDHRVGGRCLGGDAQARRRGHDYGGGHARNGVCTSSRRLGCDVRGWRGDRTRSAERAAS